MAGTQPFSIADAAAYPYTAGAPGTLVDLVAVKSIEVSPNTSSFENRGDGAVIASGTTLDSIDVTITLGALTPASLAAVAGGTAATTGTGATTVNTWTRNVGDVLAPYKLSGQTYAKDTDGGGSRVDFPFVQWSGGPGFSIADQAFPEVTINGKATQNDDGDIMVFSAYATYTALA